MRHSFTEQNFGFVSLLTNVEPELLKPQYIAEMKNLTFNNKAIDAVKSPLIIGAQIANYPITTIFLWQQDNGTKILLAQCNTDLYKWTGTAWSSIKTFTTNAKVSMVSGMLAKMYILHPIDGLFSWDGTNPVSSVIAAAPKGKYIELWYNRFFIGGNLNDGSPTTNVFRVRWSNLNDPTLWDTNDFIDFRTPENSQITGLKAYKQGLYITTESSMHQINLNFDNYQMYSGNLTPLDNQIVILNGFYYISDDGFYKLITGDIPSKLSDPYKKYWSNVSPRSITTFESKIYVLNYDNILAYDVVNESYERYVISNVNILYGADYLYLGSTDGKVYKFNQGTTYLSWSLKTKVHNFGLIDSLKRPLKITIYYKTPEAISSFVVAVYKDSEETSETLETISYTPPGYLWNSTTWNAGIWNAGLSGITKKTLQIYTNLLRVMQFEFSGSEEFGLLGYNVVIRPRYVSIG